MFNLSDAYNFVVGSLAVFGIANASVAYGAARAKPTYALWGIAASRNGKFHVFGGANKGCYDAVCSDVKNGFYQHGIIPRNPNDSR
jgi:hypothetical protein